MDTPCIKICTMEGDTGLCAGCWRTLDEIMAWSSLSSAERRRIMAALDARRLGLDAGPRRADTSVRL